MNKDKFFQYLNNARPKNYGVDFVNTQLQTLEEMKANECMNPEDERMSLDIICSALSYYLNTSPEGYGEDIIKIVERLETIYGLDNLFYELFETS